MKELYEFLLKRIDYVESNVSSSIGVGRIIELNMIKFEVEKLMKDEK